MSFTEFEQEAIILNAVMQMVDDMVNHAIFLLPGNCRKNTNLLPRTSETLRQFAILLRDFLAPITVKRGKTMPFDLPVPVHGGKQTDRTTLFYLHRVCQKPLIGKDILDLYRIIQDFTEWLEHYACVPKVWLAQIGLEVDLKIKRIDFIRMGGDIGKHNFLRLGGQVDKLQKILLMNDVTINESQAYAALPDCWEWFHTHLFAYHASTIAEFLNNIRYAIILYISDTAEVSRRTARQHDLDITTYDRPDDIQNEFAWVQYHALLSAVQKKQNFPQFSVTSSLKSQF